MSIDGTDFEIAEHGRAFYGHKFKRSGLRYEVGVCILGGDIVWINGPYECGLWPDIKIFRDALISELDEGERVEADDGYVGEAPQFVKCPKSFTNPTFMEKTQKFIRSRHETVNKRFKQFKVLKNRYRHEIVDHAEVFRACVVLTQLSINKGEPLFDVNDLYFDEGM